MRRLILQTGVSIDGYVAALDGSHPWGWRDPLRSVRSVRESYCPVVGKEDNRSDGTCEAPAHAGADHQEVAGG